MDVGLHTTPGVQAGNVVRQKSLAPDDTYAFLYNSMRAHVCDNFAHFVLFTTCDIEGDI